MKFLDLFSGIGGFRLGMEMAGHECVGHVEWDKFAQKSYMAMHNVKESEFIGWDIRKIRATELPQSDVWCFGFPCQDISVAGKQRGFEGQRSSLFFTVTKLIRELEEENKPSILFIENVKNLLSINGGFDFAKLLIELDEIGYDAEWQVLNSKYFGVPQNRERIFIIGHLRGRSGRKIFPIRETDCIHNPATEDGEVHKIAQCLTAGGNDKWSGDYIVSKVPISMTQKTYKEVDIANTLTAAGPSKGRGNYSPVNGVMIKEATKKGFAIATEGDSINLEQPNSLTRRGRVGKGVAQTLTTSCNQATIVPNWNMDKFADMMTSPPDPSKKMLNYADKNNFRIRRLTPREYFRLQGVLDKYFDKAAKVNSDSQLYKQAGNMVTVNVIYEIAKRLGDD